MKIDTLNNSKSSHLSIPLFNHAKQNYFNSSENIFANQCPTFFKHANDKNPIRNKRSDCTSDGYHIFSLLSFLISSFTTVINIVNNININNNNNNNNNNDNNNNNNNVNVNMMSRRRRRRHGKIIFNFILIYVLIV